jgi:hypothetical protein
VSSRPFVLESVRGAKPIRQAGAPPSGNLVDAGNYDFYSKTVSVAGNIGQTLQDFMGNSNDPNFRWITTSTWQYLYAKFNG